MLDLVTRFTDVWNKAFLGVSVGQLAIAMIVLLVVLLLRRFFARVVIARLRNLTRETKTEIDDQILAALQQPLMFLFIIIGLSIIVQWIPFGADAEDILVKILQSFIAFTIFWTIYRMLDPISVFFDKFLLKVAGAVANEVKDYLLKALKVFTVGSGIVAVLAQWGINPWPYLPYEPY